MTRAWKYYNDNKTLTILIINIIFPASVIIYYSAAECTKWKRTDSPWHFNRRYSCSSRVRRDYTTVWTLIVYETNKMRKIRYKLNWMRTRTRSYIIYYIKKKQVAAIVHLHNTRCAAAYTELIMIYLHNIIIMSLTGLF